MIADLSLADLIPPTGPMSAKDLIEKRIILVKCADCFPIKPIQIQGTPVSHWPYEYCPLATGPSYSRGLPPAWLVPGGLQTLPDRDTNRRAYSGSVLPWFRFACMMPKADAITAARVTRRCPGPQSVYRPRKFHSNSCGHSWEGCGTNCVLLIDTFALCKCI